MQTLEEYEDKTAAAQKAAKERHIKNAEHEFMQVCADSHPAATATSSRLCRSTNS